MLAEADSSMTSMAMDTGSNAGDETLLVRFFKHPRKNEAKTKEEGRPIFEDKTYIEIMQPGNKDSIIARPMRDADKARFPRHFAAWESRTSDEEFIEGTLLVDWPGVTRSQAEELRFFHIRTVEQLAGMSDANTQNMMGLPTLKAKATSYLDASKDNATAEALDSAQSEIAQLKEQVALLLTRDAERQNAPVEEPKPKATRKRRVVAESAETE